MKLMAVAYFLLEEDTTALLPLVPRAAFVLAIIPRCVLILKLAEKMRKGGKV